MRGEEKHKTGEAKKSKRGSEEREKGGKWKNKRLERGLDRQDRGRREEEGK